MKFRPIPMLILAGAAVAAYLVWRKSQPASTEGSAAVGGDGFGAWFENLFGNVAAGSTTPAAPAPAPAVAADNGT